MRDINWFAALLFAVDLFIRVAFSLRVILRRRPVGVSLAWLAVILLFPFVGALVYLLLGETYLGRRRARRAGDVHEPYDAWLADLRRRAAVEWTDMAPACEPLARLIEAEVGVPAVAGNSMELIDTADAIFESLIRDIDRARRTCHLEFYIWSSGGTVDALGAALMRAADRGVMCRLLLDAVGSAEFLRSEACRELRAAGIWVVESLPVGLIRILFARLDLRNHRKIAVIDGEVGYTGSQNVADPKLFKRSLGVGEWIDAMVRVEGPAVEALAVTFLEDWERETGVGLASLRDVEIVPAISVLGRCAVQVIPSGPVQWTDAVQRILLATIYGAREELVLTTPYFVPDEALLTALVSASHRGVHVRLVVPENIDSVFVRFASQAHYGDLLEAGVEILFYRGGMLHTKSITVDGERSLFGSLNLDPRSVWLNFEITLAVFDRGFTQRLRLLQRGYIEQSRAVTLEERRSRGLARRITEDAARLLGPLL